jgi:HEPN domain-containing protein
MGDPAQGWLEQADYDMATAQYLSDGGRYFYCVFMLHLSLEKALKGLYQRKLSQVPPRIHNLLTLLSRTGSVAPEAIGKFLTRLNEANVATRYPEDLKKLSQDYDHHVASEMLKRGREALEWIRQQY